MTKEEIKHNTTDDDKIVVDQEEPADATVADMNPEEIEEKQVITERDEWKDKALRLAADMDNLRKRTRREVDEAHKFGLANFARDILEVHDNLERALETMKEQDKDKEALKTVIEGINMVSKQLIQIFEKTNIKRINSIGEKLNPELHQVMVEIEHEEAAPGTVVQEMKAGYMIGERLLRPALVGTAKKPTQNENGNDNQDKKAS